MESDTLIELLKSGQYEEAGRSIPELSEMSANQLYLAIKTLTKLDKTKEREECLVHLEKMAVSKSDQVLLHLSSALIRWEQHNIPDFLIEIDFIITNPDFEHEISSLPKYIQGEVYHFIGSRFLLRGDLTTATHFLLKSEDLREEIGDEASLPGLYNNLGVLAIQQNEKDKAFQYFQQCKNYYAKMGDDSALAIIYNNLGGIFQAYGNIKEAQRCFQIAHDKALLTDNTDVKLKSLNNLGNLEVIRGNLEDARDLFLRSITLKSEIGDSRGLAHSYHNLSKLMALKGEHFSSIKLQEKALFHWSDDETGKLMTYFLLLKNYLHLKNMETARLTLKKIISLGEKQENANLVEYSYLGKAIYLSSLSHLTAKLAASTILSNLLKLESRDMETRTLIITKYLNLQLELLEIESDRTELPPNVYYYIEYLYKIGQKMGSVPLIVEVLLIKMKLAQVESDHKKFKHLSTQAYLLSEEGGFSHLIRVIVDQINSFKYFTRPRHYEEINQGLREILHRIEKVGLISS